MAGQRRKRRHGQHAFEQYARVRDAARLRELRERRGFSLRDVAALLHAPNSYTFLGRLERGITATCTVELADRWAQVLGKEFADLFELVDPKASFRAA